MNEISIHVGERIRFYRNIRGITIQQLADSINKCKTTVSKYERGEIIIDIETLVEISNVLKVPVEQIIDYQKAIENTPHKKGHNDLFYKANKLYIYFYDGRIHSINCGVIEIKNHTTDNNVVFYLNVESAENYHNCKSFYSGKLDYYNPFIRISLFNQCNDMEQLLIYIIKPMDLSKETMGLFCGISNKPLLPSANKCLISLEPQKMNDSLINCLKFSKEEIHQFKKLNLFMVDNTVLK